MRIDPQEIINSRLGVGFALLAGRLTPERFGYALAYRIADMISARRNWAMIRAVRTNQWVVSQGKLSGHELDEVVKESFRNTARAIYDLYHFFHKTKAIKKLITFNQPAQRLIDQSKAEGLGRVIVGVHMSSFDLALRAITLLGMHALALTVTDVSGGQKWLFRIRHNAGLELLPANMNSLRHAIGWLREGGIVLTGVDRPVRSNKYRPNFFGQSSVLPVHHIQLALRAEVPITVAAMIRQKDNSYQFLISDPIHMRPYPDRRTEIIANAEAVLEVAEDYIRQAPEQWSIAYPVWPELTEEVPE